MPIYLIILSASILLLIIYLILYWRRYVAVKSHESSVESQESWPGISVVIITHDSDRMLQHTIDNVAAQQYPDFEIVVVNNASTDDTNDVIKRAAKQYPNLLRSTHLPQNRNGILHMTIATTLGVRAARKEWIVLLRPNSTPKSDLWLQNIAQAVHQDCDMCIGYNQYYSYDNTAWEKHALRWHQRQQILNYRAIYRGKRKPIAAESSNIAFRKQDFLDNGGYGRWLNLSSYHEPLYATTFSTPGNTEMLMQPDAQVETLIPPILQLWETEHPQTKKAYRRLASSVKMRRHRYTFYTILALMAFALFVAGMVYSIVNGQQTTDNSPFSMFDVQYSIFNIDFPALAACAAILFVAITLIHLICKGHCWRKDRKFLNTPIVADPAEIYGE